MSIEAVGRILFHKTLGETYRNQMRDAAPPNTLTDFFTSGPSKDYPTDAVEVVKLSRVRDPAPTNTRSNPARAVPLSGKDRIRLSMWNFFDTTKLTMDALQMFRMPDQHALQDRGRVEISDQMHDFTERHRVGREVIIAKTLANADVYLDGDGDILESSSGSVRSVPTGIPAINFGQLDKANFGTGSGNIIALAWDNPAALIYDQLDDLREAAEAQSTEMPEHIWMHPYGKRWLRSNTQIGAMFAAANQNLAEALRADSFTLQNWTFHFYGGTYLASDGTVAPYIPKTKAIISPSVGSWVRQGRGRQLIPTSTQILPGMQLPNWEEMYGDFAYVLADHNPPALDLYGGNNMLFGFANPSSIFVPTVDF